jgi:DNA-binding transcriptional ArsR family regulator
MALHILAHPIRRRILESLSEKDRSYDELNKICRNHGRLAYHLRAMSGMMDKDPDRKVYTLTDNGRATWQWLLRASSDYTKRLNCEVAPEQNPSTYADKLGLSDHAFFLYDDAYSRRAIAFPFLKAGLTRQMAAVYLPSEEGMDREREEMRRRYLGFEELEERGAFTIMSAEEWYMRRGKASPDLIINNWSGLAQEKMSQGYKGLQVAGETDVFFENSKTTELFAYERKLGRKLPQSVCAMCMYDTRRLEPKQVMSLIETHGHGIFERIGLGFLA